MSQLPVLVYGHLHPHLSNNITVPISEFEKQLLILKQEGYNSISCRQLYGHLISGIQLPERPVLITFDKGHISQYQYSQEILLKHGFSATYFVIGECALKSLYDEQGFTDYMNIEHLRQLSYGRNEIALHGFSYLNFRHTTLNAIERDIHETITFFNEVDLKFAKCLAYPFGARPPWYKSPFLQHIFWKENIQLAFHMGNRVNAIQSMNRYAISRILIKGTDTEEAFIKKLGHR